MSSYMFQPQCSAGEIRLHGRLYPCISGPVPINRIRELEPVLSPDAKPDSCPPSLLLAILVPQGDDFRLLQPSACFENDILASGSSHLHSAVLTELSSDEMVALRLLLQSLPAGAMRMDPTDAAREILRNEEVLRKIEALQGATVGPAFLRRLVGETALPKKSAENVMAEYRIIWRWNNEARENKWRSFEEIIFSFKNEKTKKEIRKIRAWILENIKSGKPLESIWDLYRERKMNGGAE